MIGGCIWIRGKRSRSTFARVDEETKKGNLRAPCLAPMQKKKSSPRFSRIPRQTASTKTHCAPPASRRSCRRPGTLRAARRRQGQSPRPRKISTTTTSPPMPLLPLPQRPRLSPCSWPRIWPSPRSRRSSSSSPRRLRGVGRKRRRKGHGRALSEVRRRRSTWRRSKENKASQRQRRDRRRDAGRAPRRKRRGRASWCGLAAAAAAASASADAADAASLQAEGDTATGGGWSLPSLFSRNKKWTSKKGFSALAFTSSQKIQRAAAFSLSLF